MQKIRVRTDPGELCDSASNYSAELGEWWNARAEEPCHSRAYRMIANYVRASFPRPPDLVVDYACGAGHVLSRLCVAFPDARLVGIDASSFLLDLARQRLARCGTRALRRTSLVETVLPGIRRPESAADLVVYVFPNLVPSSARDADRSFRRFLAGTDRSAAAALSRTTGPGDVVDDPEMFRRTLLLGRLVSLDLRKLLKRGGVCVRVEYAAARRHDLSRTDLMRVSFEEGSFDLDVDGVAPRQWFRVAASSFFRSRVIEDVYQQTGDPRDRHGGYAITVLRAV